MFATFSGPRATQLVLTTPPSAAVAGASFGVQPVGELRDTRGIRAVGCGGAVIRAELVSGPGALQGVTTATVDASGAFAFSTLGVTAVGTYSLRFRVVGFAPVVTASGIEAGAGGAQSRTLASAVVRVTTVGMTRGFAGDVLEPAGFTLINERQYNTLTDTAWSNNQRITDGGTIVSDSTAPKSPNNVVELFYPAGTSMDGNEPWSSGYEFPTDRRYPRIYSEFVFKFSSNWKSHASGVNKLYYWWCGVVAGDRARLYALARGLGDEDGELRLEFVRQDGPEPDQQLLPANVNTAARIVRDQWHIGRMIAQVNTPGSANGTLRWSLDGVEVGNYTNITFVEAGEILAWTGCEDTGVWGGFGGSVVIPAGGQRQWHDNLYLSGGASV
jgi:hypothetical protein